MDLDDILQGMYGDCTTLAVDFCNRWDMYTGQVEMSRRFSTSVRYLQTGRVWREVRTACGCHTPYKEMAMSMSIVGVVEKKSFEDIERGEYR